MKTIISFSVGFLLLTLTAGAQKPIKITDDSIKFGNSTMPAFSVVIPEADYDKTVKNWVKELQSGTKSKVVEKGDEVSIFGAKLKKVSENPINVYSKIKHESDGINLIVAYELDKDKFVGTSERSDAREYLFGFARDQYLSVANDQLQEEKKKLNELERELNSLQRDQERMEKSIKSNTISLAEEKARLNLLNNDLSDTSTNVGMAGREPDNKDLAKEQKKAEREIKATEKKISKAEEEVRDNERALPENRKQQELARQRVAEQDAVVKKYEDKMDAIKNSRVN
jgi:peptidoglycan hydrolase CwlO-like protein